MLGVCTRALVRVCACVCVCVCVCVSLQVMREVSAFLSSQPTETLVMRIKQDAPPGVNTRTLDSTLNDYIQTYRQVRAGPAMMVLHANTRTHVSCARAPTHTHTHSSPTRTLLYASQGVCVCVCVYVCVCVCVFTVAMVPQ